MEAVHPEGGFNQQDLFFLREGTGIQSDKMVDWWNTDAER